MKISLHVGRKGNIFSYVPDISSAKGAAEDMLRLIDSNPEIDAGTTDGKILDKIVGNIELRDIHFRYRKLSAPYHLAVPLTQI